MTTKVAKKKPSRYSSAPLAIYEKAFGPGHPSTAITLNNLAKLYYNNGRYEEAERNYQRALLILEKTFGQNHPNSAKARANYADFLRNTGRDHLENSD